MTQRLAFPDHIFKAYDIRGVYPDELDEELAFSIGRAFATFLQQEKKRTDLSIVAAADMRVSSPQLKQHIVQGITKQGANVVDIGLASTPTFYFAVAEYNFDGGIIVSASHNPKDYNGCKMVRNHAIPISKETGIFSIRELSRKNKFNSQTKMGKVIAKKQVLSDQIKHALTHI
ncbi:MAG TPA: phosphomannomutase/phosphoglucomutase, partial [Candidatus Thermoplasmatota archaeon]|nr:phosphomannomutase/phosphoglucomutase [Candidatus Thermoplasmatota archaeon]